MVTVRLADVERDALAILDGAKDFIARMDFTEGLPEDDAGLIEAVKALIAAGMEIAVTEHEGRIVGGIGMLPVPSAWNPKIAVDSERFWWTAPGAPPTTALALLRWAMGRGPKLKAFVKLTSSPDGVTDVYRRLGLRKIEETWIGIV